MKNLSGLDGHTSDFDNTHLNNSIIEARQMTPANARSRSTKSNRTAKFIRIIDDFISNFSVDTGSRFEPYAGSGGSVVAPANQGPDLQSISKFAE